MRMLREGAAMRKEFLDRVAAPIADKMLECFLLRRPSHSSRRSSFRSLRPHSCWRQLHHSFR